MTPHPSNYRSLTAYRAAQAEFQKVMDKQVADYLAAHPVQQPKQARRFRPLVWLAMAATFVVGLCCGCLEEAEDYNREHDLP